MANKILDAAVEYVRMHRGKTSTCGRTTIDGTINDAANIFAASYDEYMTIFDALTRLFNE